MASVRAVPELPSPQPFSILPMFGREFTKGEPFDIGWYGYSGDYPDPSEFIHLPFTGTDAAFPGAEHYKPRLAAASRLRGEQRLHAYGQLDIDLIRHAAPAVAFANLTAEDFSPHVSAARSSNRSTAWTSARYVDAANARSALAPRAPRPRPAPRRTRSAVARNEPLERALLPFD
jgi:hypothetical protein